MKTAVLLVLVLLGLLAGYAWFSGQAASGPDTPRAAQVELTGTVTLVDLDQVAVDGPARIHLAGEAGSDHVVAVPSMGIRLCAAYDRIASPWDIAVGDRVAVRGQLNDVDEIVPCESEAHYLEVTGRHEDPDLGYRFAYRKGPDGYAVVRESAEQGTVPLTGIALFKRAEYEEFLGTSEAREGPASFQVRVYDNTGKAWPAVWALRHPAETNHALAVAEPVEAVVGGANAVYFVADGLWPVETYVVAHDSRIWVLQGMTPDAEWKSDFHQLVASLEFIRGEGQDQG